MLSMLSMSVINHSRSSTYTFTSRLFSPLLACSLIAITGPSKQLIISESLSCPKSHQLQSTVFVKLYIYSKTIKYDIDFLRKFTSTQQRCTLPVTHSISYIIVIRTLVYDKSSSYIYIYIHIYIFN